MSGEEKENQSSRVKRQQVHAELNCKFINLLSRSLPLGLASTTHPMLFCWAKGAYM